MTGGGTPTERLTAFSDGVFSVIITIMVLDLKPPAQAKLSALLPLWAYCFELSGQLSVRCHHLDQPSPPLAFCAQCYTKAHMVEFCTSVHDFTRTLFDCLDCRYKARCRPGPFLCSGIRNGQYCVLGVVQIYRALRCSCSGYSPRTGWSEGKPDPTRQSDSHPVGGRQEHWKLDWWRRIVRLRLAA
jgi:hypothetical protein